MGWGSATETIEPQISTMHVAVTNEEMIEALAESLLVTLIKQLQSGDWDTEHETLERFTHVPWVVRAFKTCGVEIHIKDEDALVSLVLKIIKASVSADYYDLSDTFTQHNLASELAEAIAPKVKEWA